MAILLEIFPEDLMDPQSCENFIGIVSIFELLIELIRSASIGNAAIEVDQAYCKILSDYKALFELLMDYARLGIV